MTGAWLSFVTVFHAVRLPDQASHLPSRPEQRPKTSRARVAQVYQSIGATTRFSALLCSRAPNPLVMSHTLHETQSREEKKQ
jgi:hypothetical protein